MHRFSGLLSLPQVRETQPCVPKAGVAHRDPTVKSRSLCGGTVVKRGLRFRLGGWRDVCQADGVGLQA